jgi:hypothetical protein
VAVDGLLLGGLVEALAAVRSAIRSTDRIVLCVHA